MSRSAFETRSISFACSVRLLYFRLCWGSEGNNALSVCWWCYKREERMEWHVSMNQTRSADGAGSFYRPQDLPAQHSCLSLSGHSAQHSTHAAAGTQMCADRRGLHEGSPCLLDTLTTQHPNGAQQAPTYRPLALRPPARNGAIPEKQVWGFESAIYTKDMLALANVTT